MIKSVHIAKLRQRHHKILNNILLHLPNHDLKDICMLNYRTIKNSNCKYNTSFFIFFFLSCNIIKTDALGFLQFVLNMIYKCWIITWMKEANNFQKSKFCFQFQFGVVYKSVPYEKRM